MTLTQEKIEDIEAQTQDVLTSYFSDKDFSYPIPIEKIAESNGLIVKLGKFKDKNVSGILKRKDHGGNVYISAAEPKYRQSFTIAHELGHFLIHSDRKQEEILYRRDVINLNTEDQTIESEANWFAASILMPEEKFTEYWKATKNESLIADYFGVSPTAVRLRVKNLNLEQ
jgi:Zn-dependent peptidase ImmA (M78 family)